MLGDSDTSDSSYAKRTPSAPHGQSNVVRGTLLGAGSSLQKEGSSGRSPNQQAAARIVLEIMIYSTPIVRHR